MPDPEQELTSEIEETTPPADSMFGDLASTPTSIPDHLLKGPQFEPSSSEEPEILEEPEPTPTEKAIESGMFEEEPEEVEAEEIPGDPDDDLDWEEMISEFGPEVIDSIRMFMHVPLYSFINSDTEEEKEYRELFAQTERDELEEARLQYLHERVFYRKEQKKSFIDAVPYSAKQRARVRKVLQRLVAKLDGGSAPLWLVLLLVFVLPEIMLIGRAFVDKMNVPD